MDFSVSKVSAESDRKGNSVLGSFEELEGLGGRDGFCWNFKKISVNLQQKMMLFYYQFLL